MYFYLLLYHKVFLYFKQDLEFLWTSVKVSIPIRYKNERKKIN